MKCNVKRSSDRPEKRSQRSPQPKVATKRNIPVPEFIRQLQRLLGISAPKPAKRLNNRLFRPIAGTIAKLNQLDKAALDLYSYLAFYMEPDEYYVQNPTWLEQELQSGQHDQAIAILQAEGLLEVEAVRGVA